MNTVQQGSVCVSLPETVTLPAEAGNMTPDEIRRTTKARQDVDAVCTEVAGVMARAPTDFVPPAHASQQDMLAAGAKSLAIRRSREDLELLGKKFRQAEMLVDAQAWNLILDLYNQVKTQAKRHPGLLDHFKVLVDLFARKPGSKK